MGTLAAEYGWDECYILHLLSFPRGEQYYHVVLRRSGWRTYLPPSGTPEDRLREVEEAEQAAAFDEKPSEEMQAMFDRWNV